MNDLEAEKFAVKALLAASEYRIETLEAKLREIESQAVCVGMDGPEGDAKMVINCGDIASKSLGTKTEVNECPTCNGEEGTYMGRHCNDCGRDTRIPLSKEG